MTPERLVQAKQIFHHALALPEGERQLFVRQACVGDQDLESMVTGLLETESHGPTAVVPPPNLTRPCLSIPRS